MKKQTLFCVMTMIALSGAAQQDQSAGPRSTGTTSRPGGYATDQFEGFEAMQVDERLTQKGWSLWYSVSEETAPKQLAYAKKAYADKRLRRARKGYEALLRKWPTSKEAAEAQLSLAQLYEARKDYERAFEEYQYLLTFYAGSCPYQEVLDRQYKLANALRSDDRSMFGWLLSDSDANRIRYEQIVRNAPRSPLAPKCMLLAGDIRREEKEIDEAIKIYDGLLNRYPRSDEAGIAAFFAAEARYNRAQGQETNEANIRDAITFMKTLITIMPGHPQREQLITWLAELSTQLEEHNFKTASFYDSQQRNKAAAISAYRRFLSDFRESKHAEHVRQRLMELEPAAESPKGTDK